MLPPGLSFNAVSAKARKASETAKLPRCYWDWQWMRDVNGSGQFPYTPAIQHMYGLKEALAMLADEGLDNVFARHKRLAEATRIAVNAWGLKTVCADAREHSQSVTAVFVPEGHDADLMRAIVLKRHNMALGGGLARFAKRVFRVGHMGDCNDLMIAGALAGVEMGLKAAGIPHKPGGAQAANDFLAKAA
jgi:alanine-glyoxylate transaminase/serine-glyoxylate transaminase/serine-pyruvate transaminase